MWKRLKQNDVQKEISKDIKSIKRIYENDGIEKIVKQIEHYYLSNKHTENILFHRVNILENQKNMIEAISNFIIGIAFGIAIDSAPKELFKSNFSWKYAFNMGKTLIILILVLIWALVYIRNESSSEDGRNNYLATKEIEVIIKILEERNKRTIRRSSLRRTR